MHSSDSKHLIERYMAAFFTVFKRFFSEIRDAVQEDLTPDQYLVLRYLNCRNRCTAKELSDSFLVGKSSITAIVTRLSDRGLIRRVRDSADRRQVYLSLSDRGRGVLRQADKKVQEMLSAYLVHFEESEVKAYIETLEKLAKLMGRA